MSLTSIIAYHPDTTDIALLEKDGLYWVGMKVPCFEAGPLYYPITTTYDDKCDALDRLDSFSLDILEGWT